MTVSPSRPWPQPSVLLALVAFGLGCATAPQDFETPRGPRPGDQAGPWIILGVYSRSTSTLNRANASEYFKETVHVDVPAGTEIIVPAITEWVLGFGTTVPEDTSTSSTFVWQTDDHNFGLAGLSVIVADIGPVNASATPPTRTATLTVGGMLSDINTDDEWFGRIYYTLLCLGRHP